MCAVLAGVLGFSAAPPEASANPRYAALVVDARNGEILFSRHANAPRFPASLTKVMTLYVAFEELDAGRISTSDMMRVSAHAQSQPPSELGLRQGQTISVRDAMLALVTKSANDAAAVLAEHISGSETAFARRMTETARRIGMRSTTFRNASGLPNREQVTTAHDMVLMGRAIYERFPHHYGMFSTQRFTYRGTTYRNHNRLLGAVRGVDGIKTGYIRASGFNLLSSINDRGRHLVAVVMGGRTGASRNAHMRELLERYLPHASTGPRTAPIVVARERFNPPQPTPDPRNSVAAMLAFAPQTEAPQLPQVATPIQTAAVSLPVQADMVGTHTPPVPQPLPAPTPSPTPVSMTAGSGLRLGGVPSDGWTIQIGALPTERDAISVLERAASSHDPLRGRTAYTQAVQSGGATLWRARFGGFQTRDGAQAACGALEARQFACLAVRPDR